MSFKIYTELDIIMEELKKRPAKVSKLSKKLKISEKFLERWIKLLEEKGLIEIEYPFMGSPLLKLKNNGFS